MTPYVGLAGTAAALAVALVAVPAFAQLAPQFGYPSGPVVGGARPTSPARPAPAAVPGAASNTSIQTPNTGALNGLNPTTELFEAINKGDLAAARDAISRGAQLDARNILGMTPLEDAVDLNRNGIAFLLLSIEHENRAAQGSASAAPTISAPPALASAGPATGGEGSVEDILLANGAPQSKAGTLVSSARGRARTAAIEADPAPATVGFSSVQTADPSVGFLGFQPRHETGAP